ncbi:MAG: hypothetical protein PHP06_05730 [Clostridia bacterium]|nr:hypothetical protein [Clostridia bacterium]
MYIKSTLKSKTTCLGIAWAFFSWIPLFSDKTIIYGWIVSLPSSIALNIEKMLFSNFLTQMHYVSFLISIIIGALCGYSIGSLSALSFIKKAKKRKGCS